MLDLLGNRRQSMASTVEVALELFGDLNTKLFLLADQLAVDILDRLLQRFTRVPAFEDHRVPGVGEVPRREVVAKDDGLFSKPLPLLLDRLDILLWPREVVKGMDIGGVPLCFNAEQGFQLF